MLQKCQMYELRKDRSVKRIQFKNNNNKKQL